MASGESITSETEPPAPRAVPAADTLGTLVPVSGSRVRGLLGLAVGLLLGAALVSFVVTLARVDGRSMEPTLRDGQLVVLLRPPLERLIGALRAGEPGAEPGNGHGYRVGDVVALVAPGEKGLKLKRIVAVGPATVALEAGELSVDGELSRVGEVAGYAGGSDLAPQVLRAGEVFVMGDNRRPLASNDSRAFGPVPVSSLRGRLVARLPLP